VGREGVGVRVGSNSYDMTNLRDVVSSVLDGGALHGFQVLLRRSDSKDEMVFRIPARPESPGGAARALRDAMDTINEEWADEVRGGLIDPLLVGWIKVQDLHTHERTGKLREIVDLRYQALSESDKMESKPWAKT
jgi:phenylacetate-CoA ligase